MIDYKYLEIMNAAAMNAENISFDGTFVFKDRDIPDLLKNDAEKNGILFDKASASNEFKIENDNITIFSNFEHAIASVSMNFQNNKTYCYYSEEEKRLVILIFNTDNIPCSFYFSDEKNLGNSIEYSLSNIVYWKKIFDLLCNNVSDGSDSDRSFFINSFEKGKCFFEYSSYSISFNNIDLQNTYNHFLSVIELTKLYPMLLKNRCVERLSKTGKSTLENLIFELDEICNKVETDFAIFVEKIDFDSYIQKYNERLSEFISQARNIIEKMFSNIFTLPLTYAGAILTFDKLEDNTFTPLIYVAMWFYTIFSCGFLFYEFWDTFSLSRNFDNVLLSYTNNSPILLAKVKPDIKVINSRILGIRIVCWILIIIFIVLIILLGFKFFNNPSNIGTS